ncbi:MAG TPA: NAD(P)/FAD-dependent oxidoreductase [Gemmataceae bacterium]|nr:NAD(P)/FAD-dependent oxidoreductase [Gemmataceae bacterium]
MTVSREAQRSGAERGNGDALRSEDSASRLKAFEVAVVGAGAAGLMAAMRAAERGKRVLLLEKNRKPGVKILMSGGTRCNITHATNNRGIVEAYGPPGKFLHSALAAFSVQDTLDFFEAEGVATKVEETGKVFPVSDKALDVLNALLRRLQRSGATLALDEPLQRLSPHGDIFELATPKRTLTAEKVILTTGGKSYPGSGTTGDGYAFAAQWGHTIVPPRPALVPVRITAPWVADLRGITLPDVRVRILEGESVLDQRRGSLLFAHFGLTGPVILDISRTISGHSRPNSLQLEIDLLPPLKEADVDEFLRRQAQESGKKQLTVVLTSLLPRRLCDHVLSLCGLPIERKAAALSREERACIIAVVKRLRLPVAGTLGFEKAEVTAGGIALNEVDSRNMQSKLVPNLFLAGEVLDLDGPIGGYNFQAAWSTGWLAGNSV